MEETWRWIESEAVDGATNMATDQALLEYAEIFGSPTLRVYRWFPYCISLGYHQSENDIDFDICRERHIDVVRRPTGGRAVFHAEEVTYAVVVPQRASIFRSSIAAVYNQINAGLIAGIKKLGIPAKLEKRSVDFHEHYKNELSLSCFSATAKYEIMVRGKKLVGSAQKRLSRSLLQHGSILLGSAHLMLPELIREKEDAVRQQMKNMLMKKTISLGEYLKRKVSFQEAVEHVKQGMEEVLSIRFVDEDLTVQEKECSERLRQRFSILSCRNDLI